MIVKNLLTKALYKAGFLPPIHATIDEYKSAVERGDANAVRMSYMPKPRASFTERLQESFIRTAYKTSIIKPLVVDFDTYDRARETGNPNHVRMVRAPEPKAEI